ncbi:hypothetical protein ABZ707_18645 [Streptomyces sp. NPDC006923]|uniref:hypothetical protein n=1 Tax=Streptomyces sp. NPDC006923 TaxID=3155355 RepID=UPI0033F1BA95
MDSVSATRRSPPRSFRSARWPVVGVLLVMAALTAGWPLIDRTLDNGEGLRDGTILELGPGDDIATLRVVGTGWTLSKSSSDPDSAYTLSRNGVELVADYVDFPGTGGVEELWTGLRKVQSVADGDSRLGSPRAVISAGGAVGRTGALIRDGRAGTATVWLSPGRSYAVEVIVLAEPRTGQGPLADATATARSVSFSEETL